MSCPEGALEPSPGDSHRPSLALEGRPQPLDKLHGSQTSGTSAACSQLPPHLHYLCPQTPCPGNQCHGSHRKEGSGKLTSIILKRKDVEKLLSGRIWRNWKLHPLLMGIQTVCLCREFCRLLKTVKHRIIHYLAVLL